MQIYTAHETHYQVFKDFFRGHSVKILPKDYLNLKADLVIFTGGEDIDPSYYGGIRHGDWYDKARDEFELEVLLNIRKGKFSVNKVLGICRGLQIMNVAMGGSLVHDIASFYGKPHSMTHPINWVCPNLFSKAFTMVNSMHHQCIRSIGDGISSRILGVEPESGIIEAITWPDKYLAFQFHPQLWRDDKERNEISALILRWVAGEVTVFGKEIAPKPTAKVEPKAFTSIPDAKMYDLGYKPTFVENPEPILFTDADAEEEDEEFHPDIQEDDDEDTNW